MVQKHKQHSMTSTSLHTTLQLPFTSEFPTFTHLNVSYAVRTNMLLTYTSLLSLMLANWQWKLILREKVAF